MDYLLDLSRTPHRHFQSEFFEDWAKVRGEDPGLFGLAEVAGLVGDLTLIEPARQFFEIARGIDAFVSEAIRSVDRPVVMGTFAAYLALHSSSTVT